MEIMHKNNMIYIGKQICLYLKNKVNSNLVTIYYCKMGYSKYLHEGPKKKMLPKTMLATRYNKHLYNKVLDNNEQHSLPH